MCLQRAGEHGLCVPGGRHAGGRPCYAGVPEFVDGVGAERARAESVRRVKKLGGIQYVGWWGLGRCLSTPNARLSENGPVALMYFARGSAISRQPNRISIDSDLRRALACRSSYLW